MTELACRATPVELAGGAGKTTPLEVLAGLQPPSAGQLWRDGVVGGARVGTDETRPFLDRDAPGIV